jgi:hypothetical protein
MFTMRFEVVMPQEPFFIAQDLMSTAIALASIIPAGKDVEFLGQKTHMHVIRRLKRIKR